MNAKEYEQIYCDYITRNQKNFTVGMVEQLYNHLFYNDKPLYKELDALGLNLLMGSLTQMYHRGLVVGVETAFDEMKGWMS